MAALWPRGMYVPAEEPKAGVVISIILSLAAMAVMSVCLSRRVQNIRVWSRLPLVCWLVIIIYSDSMAFVTCTAVLSNGFGVNSSLDICSGAILLCLICYMTTKLIYYFLVEKVYIIRRVTNPRLKDPLYLFNCFGMLIPYVIVVVLNFVFRIARIDNGVCYIGMKKVAMIPLISFDVLVNVYLTALFLVPLHGLYSYKNNPASLARTVAFRTFIGSCCTLTSSVVNLTVLMVLDGEPGWICLMCCNVDILFSVLVIHWVTSKDNASTLPTPSHPSESHSLRGSDVGKSRITTLVTARSKDATEEEGEIQRDLELPKMAIMVKKEVDFEERLERATLWSGMVGQAQERLGKMDSQEGLVLR